MDHSSHDYRTGEGGNDVERTLKMVASGVVGSNYGTTEVSVKHINYTFHLFLFLLVNIRSHNF